MNRVMYRAQDYTDNIEARLRKNQRYQKSLSRLHNAALQRSGNPEEFERAYAENGRIYYNTPYSRNTYMGLSKG